MLAHKGATALADLTFHYKSRPVVMIFTTLLGFGCAAFFTYLALYEDNLELRFLGIYAAGWEATALAWFFAVFMAGLGCFGIFALLRSLRQPKSVTLTATSVIAPKAPISKVMIDVPYSDIIKLQKEDLIGQVFLYVVHPGGKLSIPKSYLADKTGFEKLHRELHARWDAATGVNVS